MAELIEGRRFRLGVDVATAHWNKANEYWGFLTDQPAPLQRTYVALGRHILRVINRTDGGVILAGIGPIHDHIHIRE